MGKNQIALPNDFEIIDGLPMRKSLSPVRTGVAGLPEGFELVDSNKATAPSPISAPREMTRQEAARIAITNPFNFGAEAKARVAALTAKILGGDATKDFSYDELVDEAKKVEEEKIATAKEKYPVQSALLGIASDLPFAVAAAEKMGLSKVGGAVEKAASPYLPKAAGLLGKTAQNVIGGYGAGVVSGAGASEKEFSKDTAGVLADAQKSGEVSALISGALTPIAPIIGKGVAATKGLFSRKTAEQVAEEAIPVAAAREGLEHIRTSPVGQPTTALDITNPEVQSFVKSALSKTPQAKNIARDFALGRQKEAMKRIDDTLSKDVSEVEEYFGDLSKKRELQKIRGAENYEIANKYTPIGIGATAEKDLFGGHIFQDKELSDLITTRPTFTKAAAKEAADLIQLEKGIVVDPDEILKPSARNIDSIKRGLDSLISKETDALGKVSPKGRELEIYKKKILNRMDDLNPDYKKARSIYAGDFAVQRAQEIGLKFDKMHPEEISIQMKDFGQSEKDAFRIGQRLRLQEMSPGKIVVNEKIKKQVAASFDGDSVKASQFIRKMEDEVSYDDAIKKLGLNKPQSLDERSGFVRSVFASLVSVMTTGYGKAQLAVNAAKLGEETLIRSYAGLNKKNAEELAKIFVNRKASSELLQRIVDRADEQQKPIVQNAARDILPALLGSGAGASEIENAQNK